MLLHNDLRVDVDVTRDFDVSSFDDSSLMSCPSFTSSTSSGSRRDSIISSHYEQGYSNDSHNLTFTEAPSILSIDQIPSMTHDDLDICFINTDKTVASWNMNLVDSRFPATRACEGHHSHAVRHSHNFTLSPLKRIPSGDGLQRQIVDSLTANGAIVAGEMPAYSAATNSTTATITPTLAFGGQQYTHDFAPLTPSSELGSSPYCPTDHSQPHGMSSALWCGEPVMYETAIHPTTPSRTSSCSPKMLASQMEDAKVCRTPPKPKTTKVGKYGLVSDCPVARIECKFKSITGCTAKFQRPEHLTRHLKSAAHSIECPYVCELDGCIDQKTKERTSFNRKDNKHAHIVNCHLIDSDKPRRNRVRCPKLIHDLGWTHLLPMKEREEEKRKKKAISTAQKPAVRSHTSTKVTRRAYKQ